MNAMEFHIQKRFPDKKESIEWLIMEYPEFLALCEDYDVCVNALHYWSKSEASEAETRVNEYRTIARELEEEIYQAIEAMNPQRLD